MDTTDSRAFAARLASLLREEHHAMAEFLLALAEFDRRRGWVALGYSGLFPFLHRELGLSKAASFFRKTAAELVQRFPEVLEPLRDGRLCLTTVASLAKVLTRENRAEVLPRFFHRSGLEAKAIVAELVPASDPRPEPSSRSPRSAVPRRSRPRPLDPRLRFARANLVAPKGRDPGPRRHPSCPPRLGGWRSCRSRPPRPAST
jgi:hypothetical protein